MSILGVQIIAFLFAIFMIYVAFLHWKRKDINSGEFFFWVFLWLGFTLVALFPDILLNITKKLFFARVMDFLMVLAFMILAFLGFQNHVSNKKMGKKIEELVRKEALKEIKKVK